METRKGVMTPEQEKLLDRICEFKNRAAEAADGPIIQIGDNQGLERIKQKAEEKHPGISEEVIYPVVDGLFSVLEQIFPEEK